MVAAVNENRIVVTPLADRSRLEYVRILDFGLGGILQSPDEADRTSVKKKAGAGKGARPTTP
jgi:hypothetical protein